MKSDNLPVVVDETVTTHCSTDPSDISSECALVRPTDPCSLIILGATGDLTYRKLMPSLFNLYRSQGLPEPFNIIGCGRTRLNDQSFRDKMEAALSVTGTPDRKSWQAFAKMLYYQPLEYEDPRAYHYLRKLLTDLNRRSSTEGNRIFYLALPPSLYAPVSRMLGQAELSTERTQGNGWSRLVVEKPFGSDLDSAIALDRGIHDYFREHQVFRIDHYLAKETVQNILMFRFANTIFEPVWNRRYIDHVSIVATETLGIEHRAGYYEQAGVLRDMFQNHMMQLLALTAMEPPSAFEAERVRDEKAKVYRSLRPFPVENLNKFLVLGQYDLGSIDGRPVSAYREESGVAENSTVPTFAMVKAMVDNWRWQGVPFYLTSGKRLAGKVTQIAIQFKEIPHSMFRQTLGRNIVANRLVMGIYPDEKITLTFQTKSPGTRVRLRPVTMDFHYYKDSSGPVLDAYEKVLVDCMLGDQMLFWRQDAVELCWSYLTPILSQCEVCGESSPVLYPYASGSRGPSEIEPLLGKDASTYTDAYQVFSVQSGW